MEIAAISSQNSQILSLSFLY